MTDLAQQQPSDDQAAIEDLTFRLGQRAIEKGEDPGEEYAALMEGPTGDRWLEKEVSAHKARKMGGIGGAFERRPGGAERDWRSFFTGVSDQQQLEHILRLRRVTAEMEDTGGIADDADREWFNELMAFEQAPKTFGHKVTQLALEMIPFAQDIALGGKAVGTIGGRLIGREAMEKALAAHSMRQVGGALIRQGAHGAAAVTVADLAKEGAGALGAPVTSRTRAEFQGELARIGSRWGLTEEQGGALLTAMFSNRDEVVGALYRAGMSTLISGGSEMVGGTMAKLPPFKRIAAAQHWAVDRLMGRAGGKMAEAMKLVGRGAAYDGMFQELIEERVDEVARVVAGLATWADIAPDLEQYAVELVAFSIPGAAGILAKRGADLLPTKPGAEELAAKYPRTAEAVEKLNREEAEGEQQAQYGDVPRGTVEEEPTEPPEGLLEEVRDVRQLAGVEALYPPTSEAERAASARERAVGGRGLWFADLPAGIAGMTSKTGDIVLRRGMEGRSLEQFVMHESIHEAATADPLPFRRILRIFERKLPKQWAEFVQEVESERQGRDLPGLTSELRDEEVAALAAESLPNVLRWLSGNEEALADVWKERSFLVKVVDALAKVARTVGLKLDGPTLRRLRKMLGPDAPKEADAKAIQQLADLAGLLAQARALRKGAKRRHPESGKFMPQEPRFALERGDLQDRAAERVATQSTQAAEEVQTEIDGVRQEAEEALAALRYGPHGQAPGEAEEAGPAAEGVSEAPVDPAEAEGPRTGDWKPGVRAEAKRARGKTSAKDDGALMSALINAETVSIGKGETISSLVRGYTEDRVPSFDMRNLPVETAGDAALLFTALRSPLVERFSWMVTRGGRVVDSGISSVGVLGMAMVPSWKPNAPKPLRDSYARLLAAVKAADSGGMEDAATLWIAHNHPSGDVSPSADDGAAYRNIADGIYRDAQVETRGIIVNGERFAEWTRREGWGYGTLGGLPPLRTYEAADRGRLPSTAGPEGAAALARRIQRDPNAVLMLALTSRLHTTAVREVSGVTPRGAHRWLKGQGAAKAIIVTTSLEQYSRFSRESAPETQDVLLVDADTGQLRSSAYDSGLLWAPERPRPSPSQFFPPGVREGDPRFALDHSNFYSATEKWVEDSLLSKAKIGRAEFFALAKKARGVTTEELEDLDVAGFFKKQGKSALTVDLLQYIRAQRPALLETLYEGEGGGNRTPLEDIIEQLVESEIEDGYWSVESIIPAEEEQGTTFDIFEGTYEDEVDRLRAEAVHTFRRAGRPEPEDRGSPEWEEWEQAVGEELDTLLGLSEWFDRVWVLQPEYGAGEPRVDADGHIIAWATEGEAYDKLRDMLTDAYESWSEDNLREHYGEEPEDGEGTKWSQYQTAGAGEDYHELILSLDLPTTEFEATDHWHIDNPLLHIRANIRGDVYFLEELQSDWHQEGHTEGYAEGPHKVMFRLPQVRGEAHVDKVIAELPDQDAANRRRLELEEEIARSVRPGFFIGLRPGAPQELRDFVRTHGTRRDDLGARGGEEAYAFLDPGHIERWRRLREQAARLVWRVRRGELGIGADVALGPLWDTKYGPVRAPRNWLARGPEEIAETLRRESEGPPASHYTYVESPEGVAPAPWRQSWPRIGMKRALIEAIARGHRAIGWTTGQQQVARWTAVARQAVAEITWGPTDQPSLMRAGEAVAPRAQAVTIVTTRGQNVDLIVDGRSGNILSGYAPFTDRPLSQAVGKDVADQILGQPEGGAITDEGLTLGGQGMRTHYDVVMPKAVRDLLKKYGAKPRLGSHPKISPDVGGGVWLLDIPDAFAEFVRQQGLSTYAPRFALDKERDEALRAAREDARRRGAPSIHSWADWPSLAAPGDRERDAYEPPFRFALEPIDPTEQVQLPQMKGWDEWRTKVQDYALPIQRWEERVREIGGVIPESVRDMVSQFPGRVQSRADDIAHLEKQIIKLLRDQEFFGKTPEAALADVDDFLTAQHTPERVALLRSRDPELTEDVGSGMSLAEATEVMERLGNDPTIRAVSDLVMQLNRRTRAHMEESGLISGPRWAGDTRLPSTVELWESQMPHYVPLLSTEAEDALPRPFPGGKGFSLPAGPLVHRMEGRTTRAASPLVNSFVQARNYLLAGERNRVARALYDIVTHPENVDIIAYTEESRPPDAPDWEPGKELIRVRIDGEERFIKLTSPDVARAMKRLDFPKLPQLLAQHAVLVRWLSRMVTQWNPNFVFPNLVKDLQTAGINLTPEQQRGAFFKSLRRLPRAWAAIWHYERKKEARDTELGHFYADVYRPEGGLIGWARGSTFDEVQSSFMKDLKEWEGKRQLKSLLGVIGSFNDAIEQGTRLAVVYTLVHDYGVPVGRAIVIGRELTVDFNRRGEWGANMGAYKMFINAQIQGNAQIIINADKDPRILAISAGIAAMSFGLTLAAFYALGDDEEGDGQAWWWKKADWEKETNLLVPNMFSEKEGDTVKIPVAWGYSLFHAIGMYSADAWLRVNEGGEDASVVAEETAGKMLAAAWENFSPVSEASALQMAMPSGVMPFVQLGQNKSWHGGPILPPENPFDAAPAPRSSRHYRSASDWSKALARWWNETWGGNALRAGEILGFDVSLSPEDFDHVSEYYLGGVGKVAQNAFKLATQPWQDVGWNKVPVLRRFYSEYRPEYDQGAFYDNAEVAIRALREREAGIENQWTWAAVLGERAKAARAEVSKLRKVVDIAREQGDTDRAREVELAMYRAMAAFNRSFYGAREQR